LRSLNNRRRQQEAPSSGKPEYFYLASALIVGWLNGFPQVMEIDDHGRSFFVDREQGFHAIATGAFYFRLISKVLDVVKPEMKPLARLRLGMELTADTVVYCENQFTSGALPKAG
jgi:hypothetical protein